MSDSTKTSSFYFYFSSSSTIAVEVFRRGLKLTFNGRSGTAPESAPSPSLSISSSAGDGLLNFRFFLGIVFAFAGLRVLFRPPGEPCASSIVGVPSFDLVFSSATPFLKSETTCCSRFEAYACRFRGAYTPPAMLVSKNLSNTPWRPRLGFCGFLRVNSPLNQEIGAYSFSLAHLFDYWKQEFVGLSLRPAQLFIKESLGKYVSQVGVVNLDSRAETI